MLLRSPAQVPVAGITIVPGNVWPAQGAEYMLHILDLLKQPQVPLFLGASAPLLHTAAMAREYGRRWGPTEFIGAFARRSQGREARARREAEPAPPAARIGGGVSDFRNRTAPRRSHHSGHRSHDQHRAGAAHEARDRNQDQAHRLHGRQCARAGQCFARRRIQLLLRSRGGAHRAALAHSAEGDVRAGYLQYGADPQSRVRPGGRRAHARHRSVPRGSGQSLSGIPHAPAGRRLTCGIRWPPPT